MKCTSFKKIPAEELIDVFHVSLKNKHRTEKVGREQLDFTQDRNNELFLMTQSAVSRFISLT